MAKKRKEKATVETSKQVSTQADTLSYQGKVKCQIMHGNKIISTKNYSNNGLPDLFKYISHAIAGTYYSALRPCKIALFSCATTGHYADPTSFNWEEAFKNKALVEASPYVVYDAAPIVVATNTGCSTVFRFKIPFNWLYRKTFNVIGFFTENNSACAYYLFTKEGSNSTKEWEPQELDDVTGNYSLIIEWTMEVSNK
jgi:hypothetical protein